LSESKGFISLAEKTVDLYPTSGLIKTPSILGGLLVGVGVDVDVYVGGTGVAV